MPTSIEIDFDVYKSLTAQRESENVTFNDVLRRILGLTSPRPEQSPVAGGGCVYKGVSFPAGTQFRATYKGKTYTGEIKNGTWIDEAGQQHHSPSAAAFAITKSGINGWRFWQCKRPGDVGWALLDTLR